MKCTLRQHFIYWANMSGFLKILTIWKAKLSSWSWNFSWSLFGSGIWQWIRILVIFWVTLCLPKKWSWFYQSTFFRYVNMYVSIRLPWSIFLLKCNWRNILSHNKQAITYVQENISQIIDHFKIILNDEWDVFLTKVKSDYYVFILIF